MRCPAPLRSKTRRGTAVLLAALLLAFLLQGCAAMLDPGPPPARVQLNPVLPGRMSGPPVRKQIVIPLPAAGKDLDSDGVALLFHGREVRYLSGVRWTGTAPQLVQRGVIDALESTGILRGVGADTDGIAAQAKLLCDMRQFCLEYREGASVPVARFSATFRLVDTLDGVILGARVTETSVTAAGTDRAHLLSAMETCLGQALADMTPWVLEGMRGLTR